MVIAGEGSTMVADLESLASFAQLELDPVRRTALIELAMMKKGIDVASLPKTPPAPPQSQIQAPQSQTQATQAPNNAVEALANKQV